MFERIREIVDNAQALDERELLHDALEDAEVQKRMEDLNREQLLSGVGADGKALPRYIDDPYFKTKESAIRYQNWKKRISPNKQKPAEVIDLFITGQFHSTIKAENRPEYAVLKSDSDIASDIQSKTKGSALGLNEKSIQEILPRIKTLVASRARQIIFARN